MEQTKLISVIVPVYNVESYLRECVESVLGQSYPHFELLLVDDGSTDRSGEICDEYAAKDERVKVIHQKNGGASAARNTGLDVATGEYILFVDGDDTSAPDALETLLSLQKAEGADCIYFEADNFTDEPNTVVKANGFLQSTDYPPMPGEKLIPLLVRNKDYHAAPFVFFAPRATYDAGLRFEEGIMFEDELFSYRLLRSSKKVVCHRKKLYFRRVHAGSVMTSTGKESFRVHSIFTVFERLLADRNEKKDPVLDLYLARIGLVLLGYWDALPKERRPEYQDRYNGILGGIRATKGYGSGELLARSYGRAVWTAYVLPNRACKKMKALWKRRGGHS